MTDLLQIIAPELILIAAACVLFFLGCSRRPSVRAFTPFLALFALLAALVIAVNAFLTHTTTLDSTIGSLRLDALARFIRLLTPLVAIILLLLAWPTLPDYTGNSALRFGHDAGEFFAMFLLSIAGLMLVSVAADLIVLFLALELTSIPTYIMVSMSRPVPAAQEAALKYFFLGALSIAIMLLGFSYLYGVTGHVHFAQISAVLRASVQSTGTLSSWQLFAVLLVIVGFAYKMAAFPLHFYAGDVYEGAATPVTAFLAFVPKTAGFVALIRLLAMVGGDTFQLPPQIVNLLWALAAITMTVGNVLALLQNNVKRVLAYSSVAHSGYMLVAITALPNPSANALSGVLFYLAAYGLMNSAAFGVLMLLPPRDRRDDAAETFNDLAAQGRSHVPLGLAMAVACFSLIGIPLTVGFLGKLLLIKPALNAGLTWLAILLLINAAISATYYLHIVAVMFLRPESPIEAESPPTPLRPQFPIALAVVLSVAATLIFGSLPPAAQILTYAAALGSETSPAPSPRSTLAGQ